VHNFYYFLIINNDISYNDIFIPTKQKITRMIKQIYKFIVQLNTHY